MFRLLILMLGIMAMAAQGVKAANQKTLEAEAAMLKSLEIKPGQLKALMLETALVKGGRAEAVICHAAEDPWREAAVTIQKAIAEATGVALPLKTYAELTYEQADAQNVILLGHLDNNRLVARLYHNFFVCCDVGFTGRTGYEIRSVHDPFGAGHNYILVGGSFAEGAQKAAKVFADLVKQKGRKGDLTIGRLLEVKLDPQDRAQPVPTPMTEEVRKAAVDNNRRLMFSPGQGRSGIWRLIDYGTSFHRTGDPQAGQAYKALMLALLEYYRTDEYINSEGLGRYDRDFRDAWTHEVAILFDLIEESGIFSDQERLDITNYLIRLGLECVIYQGYNRPATLEKWCKNKDIVHNHNTFPALGVLFVGNYMKRHYKATFVDDWLKVAHGIFNGQKHSSKPQEDAAAYQWLPILHTMVYSLSQGDLTFFEEGHARDSAKVALMVMDNAGYQAAFGDHEALKSASGLGPTLRMIGWYYKDPEFLWGAQLVSRDGDYPLGQRYATDVAPIVPKEHVGVVVSRPPRQSYDYCSRGQYATPPNLPYEQTFDKLSFRGGWAHDDEYMLLDGFGRGNHMHFDANAIISFAKGGEPLLVDGEYIKNAPKYHNSLVIIRDGQAEYTPAVTGLARADNTETGGCSRTWLTKYNGAEWTRRIVWRRNDYFLVCDEVRALLPGAYTLRCCWRPWGEATVNGRVLTVTHPPMRLTVCNADGAPSRLETMKFVDRMPVSRWSQQVSLTLRPGEGYRFVNLIHAEPMGKERQMAVRQLDNGEIEVQCEGRRETVKLEERGGALPRAQTDAGALTAPALPVAWQREGFDPAPEILKVISVKSSAPPTGRYGPVEKLIDGEYSGSTSSVRWAAGVTVTIMAELAEDNQISSVVLREWQMQEGWRIGERRPEISSDGFKQDIRAVPGPFENVGQQAFGGNVNTLMGVKVGQKARQIRLTLAPAGADCTVYLAEIEVFGVRPGAITPITACATGDLNGDGHPEIVIGSAHGQIRALTADGNTLWSFTDKEGAAVKAIACFDVDGDGKAEVIYGGAGGRLCLLSAQGQPKWEAVPPKFRGLASDVMTIFPANLGGDGPSTTLGAALSQSKGGKPKIVCGCVSWQYFAYDAEGKMIWKNVIYAHSATVGCAADLDGDGKDEVIAGNSYYTLNAIDHDGKRLWRSGSIGPEMTAVATASIGDVHRAVLTGVDAGNLYCYDRDGKEMWKVNLGDKVTRVLALDLDGDKKDEIVCAAESANVFALRLDGTVLWRTALPDGVSDLAMIRGSGRPMFVAAMGASGVALLDPEGKLVAAGRTKASANRVASLEDRVVVTSDDGRVAAFDLSRNK